jgi:hypothetical protein
VLRYGAACFLGPQCPRADASAIALDPEKGLGAGRT